MKNLPLHSLCLLLIAGSLNAAEPAGIDPNAVALLKRMSTTLSNAKAFTFRTDSILETPCATEQFITLVSEGALAVQRPNKIRASYDGDGTTFDLFYNGKSVTAVAPRQKVFSTIKAPDTLDSMLSGIQRETEIHLHIAPLLFSDSYAHLTRNLQSAVIIGPTHVRGIPCDHLAFRSPGVNWEIWISSDKTALPYRLAATFTDKPNLPRKFIDLSDWNLHPWLRSSTFTFRQPRDFQEIPFKTVLKDARKKSVRDSSH